jgi:site-specific recombinase XerD
LDNKPLKQRGLQNRFNKYRNVSKIEKHFSPHILRHTFAKRAILNGMDAFSLAALLGHSDLTVTKRYVALWGNDLGEKAIRHNTLHKLKQCVRTFVCMLK